MKLNSTVFMRGVLSASTIGFILLLTVFNVSQANASSDVVQVSMSVPTYLDVDIVSSQIIINSVSASEFYQSDYPYPLQHSGSSLINLRSNVACSLRTPIDALLTHSSGAPSVPVEATIQMLGTNIADLVDFGGVYYWVLNYSPGTHNGTTILEVDVQQVWTASHAAGVYSGAITVDLLEGTF